MTILGSGGALWSLSQLLDFVVSMKQPQIICKQMGVAVFQ